MFWCPQFVFIHVPRTGGTLLTDAFGVLSYVSKDVHVNKHVPAAYAKTIIGDEIWNTATIFTVERSNQAIAKSWYSHILKEYAIRDPKEKSKCTQEWWDFVSKAALMSYIEFKNTFKMPTMEHYCDLPNIKRLSLKEAYEMLVIGLDYDPKLEIRTIDE